MRMEILKLVYSLHKDTRGQEPLSGCGIAVGWEWEHLPWEAGKPVFTQVLPLLR